MLENLKVGEKVIATFKNKTQKVITVARYREDIGAISFYELPDVYYMGGNISTTITDRDIIKIEHCPAGSVEKKDTKTKTDISTHKPKTK